MDLDLALKISDDLKALRNTQGGNAKKDQAQAWFTGEHKYFLDLVGNTNRQFYVTFAAVQKAAPSEEAMPMLELLYEAENRIATPAQTASRMKRLLLDGWPENVIKAIAEKTLDAGITVQTIKKATGARKVFTPSLCADWLKMSEAKRNKLLSTKNYCWTYKMDGLRALCKLNTPDEGFYSRSLKPLKNLDGHLALLKRLIKSKDPVILDGEMLAADGTWNSSITGTKKTGAKVKMVYHIFDMIPGQEAASQDYQMPATKRWGWIKSKIDFASHPDMLCRVLHIPVTEIPEVNAAHDRAVAKGFEGLVLHDRTAPYACKRSTAWIKVKKFLSSEFTVTGFVVGTGKHLGRLGAMLVSGEVEGKRYETEVGTGFSDEEREAIWADQDAYMGRIAEIKYFEGTDSSLRFPVFLRFREEE